MVWNVWFCGNTKCIQPIRTPHTNGCENRRNQGNAEASQIAAHHLVEHTEGIGGKDENQTGIADGDNLRIVIEDRQKLFSCQQHQCDCGGRGDQIFDQAQQQRSFAASKLPRTVVLPHKGRAGLAERVEYIVGKHLDIERCAGCRHDHRAKAVDGRLDYDIGESEHGTLNTGGQTDFHDPPQSGPVNPQ